MGITITMSTKRLKKKGYDIYSNKEILQTIREFDLDDINDVIFETREVILKVAKRFGFCKRKTIVSIDFHDKPFYGDKTIKEVVGTKRKFGTKLHQPRKKLLKGCRTVFKFIKKSIQKLNFYWRPSYEAELFREDIADCVKRLLA